MTKKVKRTLFISDATHKKLRVLAANKDTTMSSIVEKLVATLARQNKNCDFS